MTLSFTPVDGQEVPSKEMDQPFWFPVGETLYHEIYWGVVPVGYSRTSANWEERDGIKVLVLKIMTRTNRVFDKIRPVDDIVESVIDPATFLPIEFKRKMIRRGKVCNELTVFDHSAGQAEWESVCGVKKKTFEIKKDTLDILTFLYSLRQFSLEENAEYKAKVMADEGMHELKIVTDDKEYVSLPKYGQVKSLKIEPEFDFDGLLVKNGKFTIWVSDDERKIITRAEIKGTLADIKLILVDVSGPGDDSWVKDERDNEK